MLLKELVSEHQLLSRKAVVRLSPSECSHDSIASSSSNAAWQLRVHYQGGQQFGGKILR